MLRKPLSFLIIFVAILFPHIAISQSLGCLSAYGCNELNYNSDEIDYSVDLYIINMEFNNYQIHPPGQERRACEQGCHEGGDEIAEMCRAHSDTITQRICLSKLMDAVDKCIKCIRNCA